MKTFAFASLAAVTAASNFRVLSDSDQAWEEWDDMEPWEHLFACSLTTGMITLALCPNDPDDCDDQLEQFFDNLASAGLTPDEVAFWTACAAIFEDPDSECDDFMMQGDCEPHKSVGDCIEKAFQDDPELKFANDDEKAAAALGFAATAAVCSWDMDTDVCDYAEEIKGCGSGACHLIAAGAALLALAVF